jgi:hypothetical protein
MNGVRLCWRFVIGVASLGVMAGYADQYAADRLASLVLDWPDDEKVLRHLKSHPSRCDLGLTGYRSTTDWTIHDRYRMGN